ncbi:TIGR00289 family protein [Candidatus Pacearchaeota archaeon]|nr:TIGR00289 family protein [Candidatus Pacearchaeota archaeon]
MKLAVLFSGGKDSCLALSKAMKGNEIVCLISITSKNKESYMFHTPNIQITKLQAEAIGIPLLTVETKGEKEKELLDLKKAILKAKKKYKIQGIITGAVRSVYQASRIQKICKELGLKCINPLWQMDQIKLLKEVLRKKFRVIISGVFAYPLDRELLGKQINNDFIKKMVGWQEKYKINPAGEGGEIETTVLDAPFFKKKIQILQSKISYENYAGIFEIKKARLVKK